MKTLNVVLSNRSRLLMIAAIALAALSSLTIFSRARSQTISITLVNNASREVRHVYLSPPDSDNWGSDQLNGTVIGSGGSFTLNVSCEGTSIKVIAEDQNGCFLYQTVSCAQNSTVTITNDATPDCGN